MLLIERSALMSTQVLQSDIDLSYLGILLWSLLLLLLHIIYYYYIDIYSANTKVLRRQPEIKFLYKFDFENQTIKKSTGNKTFI